MLQVWDAHKVDSDAPNVDAINEVFTIECGYSDILGSDNDLDRVIAAIEWGDFTVNADDGLRPFYWYMAQDGTSRYANGAAVYPDTLTEVSDECLESMYAYDSLDEE